MNQPRILVVEDEAEIRKHLVRALRREGMVVDEAEDGEAAWQLFERHPYPVVLLDLRLPKLGGLALLERIQKRRPETQVVILTGHGDKNDAVKAVNLHAAAFLEKPPDLDLILEKIRQGFAEYRERTGEAELLDAEGQPPDLAEIRAILRDIPVDDILAEEKGQ